MSGKWGPFYSDSGYSAGLCHYGPMVQADSYITAMAMRKSAKFYYVGKNGPIQLLKRLVLRSMDARMALRAQFIIIL